MPISSTEVSSIIQSQVGMFSASSAYSQAISAQYGYQSMGGMSVGDSRSQQGLSAGGIGSSMAQMPGMALGAMSMASMFGAGPAFMDPFSMTFRMGHGAYGARGMAGAVGAGAATFGAYSALGSMGNWATNQMMTGAQNRGMLNATMGGMFPQASSNQLGQLSGMVENAARQGMGSVRELTGIMQAGVGSDMISMNSIQEFSMSFQKLVGNVRNVANTLKSSLTEAYSAMSSIKGMGIQDSDAAGVAGFMRGMGRGVGLSPAQLTGVGTAGANLARQVGIPQATGAMGAMVSAGVYRLADLHNIAPGFRAEDQGRYTQAAFRFLGSRRGRAAVGAMMGPDGEYDPQAGFAVSQGLMSGSEMRSRHAKLMGTAEGRDLFRSRRSEIAGQFVSEFGPESISSPLGALSRNQTMSQALTGLNRQDLSALNTLASSGPMLRNQVIDAARSGFNEGARQVSLGDAISQSISKITQPIKEKFQQFGASLTQGVQEALDQVTSEFTRGGRGGGSSQDHNFWSSEYSKAQSPFATSARRGWDNLPSFGGLGSGQASFGPPGSSGPISDLIRGSVPMGLRIGALGPGTSLSELPMGGFGLERYSPGLSAFAASTVGIGPGGRNVWGMAGLGLDRMGAGGMRLFRGAEAGPFGMGGMGPISGSARLGATATRGLGLALRGGGALLRGLSYPMLAYDMASNVVPEMRRRRGMAGISEGAITGRNSQFLQYLSQTGALGDSGLARHTVGDEGLDYQSAQRLGLTPLGGSFEAGSKGGPGSQSFISEKQMQQANEILTGGSLKNIKAKYGTQAFSDAQAAAAAGGSFEEKHTRVASALPGASPQEVGAIVSSASGMDDTLRYANPGSIINQVKKDLRTAASALSSGNPNLSPEAAEQAAKDSSANPETLVSSYGGVALGSVNTKVADYGRAGNIGLASSLLGDQGGRGALNLFAKHSMSGTDFAGLSNADQSQLLAQLGASKTFTDALGRNEGVGVKEFARDFLSRSGGKLQGYAQLALSPVRIMAEQARQKDATTWTQAANEGPGPRLAEHAAAESGLPWKQQGPNDTNFGWVAGQGAPAWAQSKGRVGLSDIRDNYKFAVEGGKVVDTRQETGQFWVSSLQSSFELGKLDMDDFRETLGELGKGGLKDRELATMGARWARMVNMAKGSGMRPGNWENVERERQNDGSYTGRRGRGNMGKWLSKVTGNEGILRAAKRDKETSDFFSGKRSAMTLSAQRELWQSADSMLRGVGISDENQTSALAADMLAAVRGGPGSDEHKKLIEKVATMRANPNPKQGGEGGGNLVELSNNVGTALSNLKTYIDNTVGNQTHQ